ncbi:MAG: L-serine ammonia-lyase, iron-sulfur-dependent, subunit alpha [Clostridiales bacterium]|nr:L-serine ammonia-lyase, iron-sulfur-dependent, subunit alpha [Clostridiales bacterium]
MDFRSGKELLELCVQEQLPISQVMKLREIELQETSEKEVNSKMKKALNIMRNAAYDPIKNEVSSIGGLIGGEAKKLENLRVEGKSLCGGAISKAMAYAMAVLEVNASMGVIVAAPTAGSSGVLPGVLLSLQEEYGLSDDQILEGLYTAGAVGYLLMRNASVSGAQAGCQAEVGSAAAMAAAAAVEMMGGTPDQALSAATGAISNLLGLVCDPVRGLVENPCQNRNAIGAANALINAEQALAGITQLIPFDEMVQAMYHVGRSLPFELRESALGGCAATPTACNMNCPSCT